MSRIKEVILMAVCQARWSTRWFVGEWGILVGVAILGTWSIPLHSKASRVDPLPCARHKAILIFILPIIKPRISWKEQSNHHPLHIDIWKFHPLYMNILNPQSINQLHIGHNIYWNFRRIQQCLKVNVQYIYSLYS